MAMRNIIPCGISIAIFIFSFIINSMLNKLRKKGREKTIWIILAILILPAFVFWGLGSIVQEKQKSGAVGKIAGRRIGLTEYSDALNSVKNQAIMQLGDNFAEIQKYLNLESQAWDRLILLSEAKKRRLAVKDIELIELLQKYPIFQRNGQFDNRLYNQVLQYVLRTLPRTFEEQTRENLLLAKLYQEVTQRLALNEEQIKQEYKKLNEQISVDYIAAITSEFAKNITPNQEEIKTYFDNNALLFKEPLSFNIEYLASDEPEKINKALASLERKNDFAKAAKEFNLEVKETGLFRESGPIPGIGWSPQMLGVIAKLKVGQFLKRPLQIDKNYYLLRLKERKEPYIPEFAAVKDKAKEMFIKDKSRERAQEKIEKCLEELKGLQQSNPKWIDFAKISKTYALKSDATAPFKYGSYIEGIGASDNFFLAAKNLKDNQFSGVIEMPSGFYIVKLKSYSRIDENKFNQEKDAFQKQLLSQKKEEYFNKFLEDLRKKTQKF